MTFAAFCLCHRFDARLRFDALVQLLLRRRLIQEQQDRHARIIAAALDLEQAS